MMKSTRNKVWLETQAYSDTITVDSIKELQKAERNTKKPLTFVAWSQIDDEVLSEELNKSFNTTIISATERVDLLFPECGAFDNMFPNNCIISESLAYELFGSADVKGLSVTYNSKKYSINQVLKNENYLFLHYENGINEQGFREVTIANTKNESPKMLKDQFEEMTGISLRYIDYGFPVFILEVLFIFFIFLVIILSYKKIRKAQYKMPRNINELKRLICNFNTKDFLMVSLIIITGLIICSQFMGVPIDIVPTRMSDKEFWSALIEEEKSSLEFIFIKKKLYPELSYYYGQLIAIASYIGCIFCYPCFINKLRSKIPS